MLQNLAEMVLGRKPLSPASFREWYSGQTRAQFAASLYPHLFQRVKSDLPKKYHSESSEGSERDNPSFQLSELRSLRRHGPGAEPRSISAVVQVGPSVLPMRLSVVPICKLAGLTRDRCLLTRRRRHLADLLHIVGAPQQLTSSSPREVRFDPSQSQRRE
jgi:hypothetical protein